MSDVSQGDGWWQASDGKFYAPETHPHAQTQAQGGAEPNDSGSGTFGDGRATALYEFSASRFKGGRMFTPNVIRVWPDRIEEHEQHALRKTGTQAINFHQVAQVAISKGLRWTTVTVESTGGHSISMIGIPKKDGDQVKKLLDDAINECRRPAAAAPAPVQQAAAPDLADQLTRLAGLRDQGVLTEEEFSAQKAKLLA